MQACTLCAPFLLRARPPRCCRRFLDDISPDAAPASVSGGALGTLWSAACHVIMLLFASSALAMLQLGLCRPMRLG